MIRLPDGGILYPVERGLNEPFHLLRWRSDGQLDSNFRHVVSPAEIAERRGPSARALTLRSDGSVLISTAKVASGPSSPEDLYRLRRLLPDSDLRLTDLGVSDGELHATLATQPGARYEIRPRSTLTSEPLAPIYSGVGDGYLDHIILPTEGSEDFLELRRRESD
jgi:hypothetical protein